MDLLESGDFIMADRGFHIEDLALLGVRLNIPPFLNALINMKPHLPPSGTYRGKGGDLTSMMFKFIPPQVNFLQSNPRFYPG